MPPVGVNCFYYVILRLFLPIIWRLSVLTFIVLFEVDVQIDVQNN